MFKRFLTRRDAAQQPGPDQGPQAYRVYSRKHDEVVAADALLKRLPHAGAVRQAASDFRAAMAARVGALTTQAILAAGTARQDADLRSNGLITLLIDMSGSMRGVNAQLAALTTEAVAAFADVHGCKLEVLGFTTVD